VTINLREERIRGFGAEGTFVLRTISVVVAATLFACNHTRRLQQRLLRVQQTLFLSAVLELFKVIILIAQCSRLAGAMYGTCISHTEQINQQCGDWIGNCSDCHFACHLFDVSIVELCTTMKYAGPHLHGTPLDGRIRALAVSHYHQLSTCREMSQTINNAAAYSFITLDSSFNSLPFPRWCKLNIAALPACESNQRSPNSRLLSCCCRQKLKSLAWTMVSLSLLHTISICMPSPRG